MKKIAVQLILSDVAPSQYFTYYPLMNLHKRGIIQLSIELERDITQSKLRSKDLLVFSRNHSYRALKIAELLDHLSIPYIYEIDDDLFSLHDWYPESVDNPSELNFSLKRMIYGARLVRVFSKSLQEKIARINSDVVLRTPPFFWSLISGRQKGRQIDQQKIKIVYATSRFALDPLSSHFSQALLMISKLYERKIEIAFWGHIPEEFRNLPNVRYIQPINDYKNFIRKFADYGAQIGLAPMEDNSFCLSKTNNKFREYGACNIAGIYSNVPLYYSVENLITGIKVGNNPTEWFEAIEKLINDPCLRNDIIQNCHKEILEKYSEEAYFDKWISDITLSIQKQTQQIIKKPINPKFALNRSDKKNIESNNTKWQNTSSTTFIFKRLIKLISIMWEVLKMRLSLFGIEL